MHDSAHLNDVLQKILGKDAKVPENSIAFAIMGSEQKMKYCELILNKGVTEEFKAQLPKGKIVEMAIK